MIQTALTFFRSSTVRWLLAILITLASAVYQRVTGPTYPVQGQIEFERSVVQYRLLRSHNSDHNQTVTIQAPDTTISAVLSYRRVPASESWTRVGMHRSSNQLIGEIPHQPPAGKVEYRIQLHRAGQEMSLPVDHNVVTRFKGDVPAVVLIPHILFMFLAMLYSTRAGIEALDHNSNPQKLAIWTIALLLLGGFIFGPLVQKYAFGTPWTGVPFGWDLTDNKTLIALLVWLAAIFVGRGKRKTHGWVVAAAIVTLVIFLIPHSLLGSELKYPELPRR